MKRNKNISQGNSIKGNDVPVVGIGASAGGLEAISPLLKNLSPTTGVAFVYFQHLRPSHESLLSALLGKNTQMKVLEARNNLALRPNCFYVIPAGKAIKTLNGKLLLSSKKSARFPIDDFFFSLANMRGEKAIGIVLSGNASDGTRGLKAIKMKGGVTFAQDKSARFTSMPNSAIAKGVVDFILSPEKIGKKLPKIIAHAYRHSVKKKEGEVDIGIESSNEALLAINQELQLRNEQVVEAFHFSESVIATIHEPLIILDSSMRVKSANKAFYKTFHVSQKNTEGKNFFELGNKQWNIAELRELLNKVILANSEFTEFEVTHRFPSIGIKSMLLNGRRIVQKSQNEQLILLAIQDITETKLKTAALESAIKDLKHSNSELEQFAYVASHDLQEPLRKISIFSERLENVLKDSLSRDAKDYLLRISDSSKNMSKLVDELLNFSHVSSIKREFSKVDLNKSMKEVLKDFDLVIAESKARIKIGRLPVINAVPVQMNQLFHNLVSNALKFSDDSRKPEITVTSEILDQKSLPSKLGMIIHGAPGKPTRYHEICIRDNGIGFDERYVDYIFTIFSRLHSKKSSSGTGIGLALCRKITANHGGIIFARSRNKSGSEFHVILPEKQSAEV